MAFSNSALDVIVSILPCTTDPMPCFLGPFMPLGPFFPCPFLPDPFLPGLGGLWPGVCLRDSLWGIVMICGGVGCVVVEKANVEIMIGKPSPAAFIRS